MLLCYGIVCLVCCVLDSIYELFGETIRDVFGCGYIDSEVFAGDQFYVWELYTIENYNNLINN